MRPRTLSDGRNYSSLCAIRRRYVGTARHIGERLGAFGTNGTSSVHPRAFLLGGRTRANLQDRMVEFDRSEMGHQCDYERLRDCLAPANRNRPVHAGYQAAILAHLVQKVCTVEIIPPLAEAATKVLRDLGYDNVSVKVGDGYRGWLECGPFDAMIVTAALGHVPPPLIEQLKVGGRLVMPLGPAHAPQQLTVVEKISPSETRMRSIILVRFVPFTRSKD
jgi:Protein-L-isoaspartate(D-aspartate) O-methyltransferase (PCMT)